MALDQSALLELLGELQSTDVSDRIRLAMQKLYQELIDAEATAFIGAAPYERSEGRVAVRNGSRPRTLSTTAGDLDLRIPKLRTGSFFPSLLERRRRVDRALFAVVMEAYVHGVSTRKVDDLVKALGADSGISKSEVSRICQDLDEDVAAFRERPLGAQDYPYVFVDATYCKARGVRLVISDAHSGLIKAIQVAFQGASWQRCWVHFMRNVLAKVPKVAGPMVASIIRTVFVPRGKASLVKAQFGEVVGMLERSHPAVAQMLEDARDELLAFTAFPAAHWQQIWSTNPLERLNKEIKRRTDVVGTFPNPAALLRLAGHVLIEQHDEWDSADRRYFSDASMALLNTTAEEDSTPELIAA